MRSRERMSSGPGLQRVLGLAFGLAIGFGGVVGGGLLKTSGMVAGLVPNAWLIVALWLACALHSFLGGNVVAELMTALPQDGGLFVIARRAFGDFGGLVVGWADAAQNCATIAAVTILFGSFAAVLAPTLAPYGVAIAIGVQVLLLGINLIGVREGSAVQQATALLKAVMVAAIIVALFIAAGAGQTSVRGSTTATLVGAITAYQLIYGVYSGWSYPGYFGDESTNAERDIPKGIFGTIAAASVIYIGFNAALVAAADLPALARSDFAAADVVGRIFGHGSMVLVMVLAMVMVVSSANAYTLLVPRILYGLGRDGLFFRWSAHVNRGGTPDWAMIVTIVVSIGLTLSGSFDTVFLLMGAMTLFTMVVTDLAYFVLRYREPELARPFRAKGHPFFPILLVLIDGALFIAILWADPFGGMAMMAMLATALPISAIIHLIRRKQRVSVAEQRL